MKWIVPVTIVEYGREAIVEAETAKEARNKARAAEWEHCGDATRYDVRVSGSAEKEE